MFKVAIEFSLLIGIRLTVVIVFWSDTFWFLIYFTRSHRRRWLSVKLRTGRKLEQYLERKLFLIFVKPKSRKLLLESAQKYNFLTTQSPGSLNFSGGEKIRKGHFPSTFYCLPKWKWLPNIWTHSVSLVKTVEVPLLLFSIIYLKKEAGKKTTFMAKTFHKGRYFNITQNWKPAFKNMTFLGNLLLSMSDI